METHFITYRPYWDKNFKDEWDRYEDFIDIIIDNKGRIDGWSARKTFKPGDLAIFYFGQPMMSIVAVAQVDSDPYVEEVDEKADWSNPVYCDFSPVVVLENELPIKEAIKRQSIIAKWWKTKPYQGIRRIDNSVSIALLKEIAARNSWFKEDMEYLVRELTIDPSSVVDKSSPVPVSGNSKRTSSKPKSKQKRKNWTVRDLKRLDWRDFESLVCRLFDLEHRDAIVELTPPTVDFGVDVTITNKKSKDVQIVQCKRYRKNKVNSPDMQKFAGAMYKFKATRGYFVTSSSFNRFALKYASDLENVELIEGKQLVKMINSNDNFVSLEEFRTNL